MSTAPEPVDDGGGAPAAAVAPTVPDDAIRLALELAFGVAVLGSRQRPPLPVPSGLRPFLRFQKLPPAALGPLRRAVEADGAFRERIAAAADPTVVGEAGALWLRRPEGWQDDIAALVADEGVTDADAGGGRDRREAVRAERAERAAARAAAEVAAATEALAAERDRAAGHAAELAALTARLERAEATAARAEAEQAAAERRRVDADVARRAAEARLADVAAERDDAVARVAALADERHALQAQLADLACRLGALEAAPPPSARPAGLDAAAVAPLLADASRTMSRLGEVLDHLARAVGGDAGVGDAPVAGAARGPRSPMPSSPTPPTRPVPAVPSPVAHHRPSARPAPRSMPARRPVALPPRVRADSAEAAMHLLRRPGVVVLVDGYNVAKAAFPAARSLADERDWLADVLDELAARTSADVRVVFDGADVPPPPARRRAVQVLFSPAGVTADDVLVELTATTPVERPVVVVTDDLALRERVKAYGANVVADDQLLAAARR